MRLVSTSDTHYPPFVKRLDTGLNLVREWNVPIPDGDVFVHAGDVMRTGYPNEWDDVLEFFAALPHKHKYYIPGNHDFHLQVYPGPALQQLRQIGVMVVGLPFNPHYATVVLPNGMNMLGLPFVVGHPNWAFNMTTDRLVKYLIEVWKPDTKDIIVSHMPPKGILDLTERGEAGWDVYRNLVELNRPKYWISGHIHEGYGKTEMHGCKFYNVSMCNRDYKQVNPPMVIDL